MKGAPIFSIMVHCFYGVDSFQEQIHPLNEKYPFQLFLNSVIHNGMCNDTAITDFDFIPSQNVVFRRSTNVGKDIGGKFVLLDTYLRLGIKTKYIVFIHDKKSPHLVNGSKWFDNLIRIVEPTLVDEIINSFERNNKIGIIASRGSVMKEASSPGYFESNNGRLLSQLQKKYDVYPIDLAYVAGTMFWVRSDIITKFFQRFHPLEIRASLEEGNILDNEAGTITHSWERLLSWIVTSQGYHIKEV